ncbi:MAG TPA: class I SAM-dependent methyltransferase [Thermoanaerobaculia bacterium]
MTAGTLHARFVARRRAQVLARWIAPLLPPSASVLDLGAGDGYLGRLIAEQLPDIDICGVDVVARAESHVPILQFDGERAPFADGSFDAVIVADVLHHAEVPAALFAEGVRLARKVVIVKDHICETRLDRMILRFMDRISNARYGVPLPYNYLSRREWEALFRGAGPVISWNGRLGLYPWPASMLFDRSMHFLAAIGVEKGGRA